MHRNQILNLLDRYSAENKDEHQFKEAIKDFVIKYENCFERSLEVGHVTASAWLVDRENTHALLMHHRKLDNWFQLGGHCDGESDVLRVSIKEAQEESGILAIKAVSQNIFDVDVHVIPERLQEPAHVHYDIRFLLQVMSDKPVIKNNESKELRWIPKDRNGLPTKSPSVTRMFEKWLKIT